MSLKISTTAPSDACWFATPVNGITANQSVLSVHLAFEVNQLLPPTSLWIFTQGSSINVPFKIEVAESGNSGENFVFGYFQGPSGVASVNKPFTSSSPHFLDIVFTSGFQSFYLDGTRVATASVAGNVEPGNNTIHIGLLTGQAGLTLTISEPAIWNNYALTALDVIGLMTGQYSPLTLIGSVTGVLQSATWCPPLNGTSGHAPMAGDAALNNPGTAGNGTGNINVLSAFTITGGGSAQYAADLVFTPAPITPFVTGAGGLLAIGAQSPTGLPTADTLFTAVASTPPTVVVNGVPKLTYQPVWADTTKDLPLAVWQLLNSDGSQCHVQPTDIVTATIPFATVTTAGYGPNGPLTNALIGNYVGRYGPGLNGCPDDTPRPTMGIGYCSAGNFINDAPINPSRNARLRFPQINGGMVYDLTTNTPLYFPPNTTVFGIIADLGNSNLIDGLAMPVGTGVYSFVFKDANALDPVNYFKLWVVGFASTCAGVDNSNGPASAVGSTYVRTVASDGVTVTVSYWVKYTADPNYAHGYNLNIHVYMKSASGFVTQAGADGAPGSGPIDPDVQCYFPGDSDTTIFNEHSSPTNPSGFPTTAPNTTGYSLTVPYGGPFPNTSGNDNSDPLAISAYLKLCLVASNGNGPRSLRSIYTPFESWVNPSDLPTAAMWSYANDITNPASLVTVASIRPYNTELSTKIYHPLLGFDGTDSTGSYIDLALHNNATTGQPGTMDNGASLGGYFMEAVCSTPHGFRGMDIISWPNNSATEANYLAVTGGVATVFPSTASATQGNTTLTFLSSVTVANGATFTLDASGLGYHITTGGTGTTFTIDPPYQGTTASGLTVTTSAVVRIGPNSSQVYPTGPLSFVFDDGGIINHVSGPVAMASTSPVIVNFTGVKRYTTEGIGSLEFWTHAAVSVGAKPWLFTVPGMSDACLEQFAALIAPYCPPGTIVQIELGDEHWNGSEDLNEQCTAYGLLLDYITPGTVVNDFYTIPATGSAKMSDDEAYVAMAAHQQKVIQAKFDALDSGILVEPVFGSWYIDGNGIVTSSMVNTAIGGTLRNGNSTLTNKVPMGSIAIAPYEGPPSTNVTLNEAIATTGTNPGSWSTTLINDYYKLFFRYCTSNWNHFSHHTAAIAAYANGGVAARAGQINGLPSLIGYESAINHITGLSAAAVHDVFYDPGPHPPNFTGFGANTTCYFQSMQDGDPRVPGSGLVATNYNNLCFQFGGWTNDYWNLTFGPNQPAGDGLGNLYSTFQNLNLLPPQPPTPSINQFSSPQGGVAGGGGYNIAYERQNQSLGLNAALNWIEGGTNPPPPPTFAVQPIQIVPSDAVPQILTFVGSGTAWTNGSTISVQNSVSGTTAVTAGTWTAISTALATLSVTTGIGNGEFTVTVDGVLSQALIVAPSQSTFVILPLDPFSTHPATL